MIKKYKYIYDKRSGHYIKKLNEEDSSEQSSEETSNEEDVKDTQQEDNNETSTYKSVESDETILGINAKLSELETRYQQDLTTQRKMLDSAKESAAKESGSIYDPVLTSLSVLQILKKINDITKQYALDKASLEDQRILLLGNLGKATESFTIPEKYKYLSESNILNAKIYMKNLVGQDDTILKGMVDFKRAFKDTNILYGKDKEGYFVVAVDKADFDEVSDKLEEVGYLRDEILDTIIPQILDRKSLVL